MIKPGGYWRLVWRQFCSNRGAVIGFYFVLFFLLSALLAPLLAHRLPLFWRAPTGEISFPLLRELLAPSDTTEWALEITFNYLLFFLPGLALWRWLKLKQRILAGWTLALLLVFAGYGIFCGPRNDPTLYRQLAAEHQGWGLFAVLPYGPQENGFGPLLPPSWWHNPDAHKKSSTDMPGYHWLGTDDVGRDVLARMLHGARVSLAVGLVAVGIATLIGMIIGACAGYFGGWVDIIICRLIEIMMCFPTFFLILTIIAIMEKRSIINIMLVIGLTGWTGDARLVRGEVLKQRKLDYTAAAVALGASPWRVIFRHILPNAISPLLVSVSFGIAGAIFTESGLSFLGFGVSPPTATWGELLNQGRQSPMVNWWLVAFPGLLLFFAITAYNLVGEGLRDALDPRLKQ